MVKKNKNLVWLFLLVMPSYVIAQNRVIATIPVGNSPAGLAITPDGTLAYVANNNNAGIAGGDTVSVLDVVNNTSDATISDASFNEPYSVTISPDGTTAYVTNSNSSTVTIIDIDSNTVSGTITGFDGPSGLVINPVTPNIAYVNNYGYAGGVGSGNGTTVRVVNLDTNLIVGLPITVGQAPAGLAITPDGAYVYVINYVDGNAGTGTVSVIRTSDNSVVSTISGFSGPFSIAITPNGSYAYVTNFGSNNFSPVGTTVSVINLATNQISATINLGTQPAGVAITPDGKFVYVTNYNTLYLGAGFTDLTPGVGTVNVIDTSNNQVLKPVIVVGSSPGAIAISPNGTRAYVTNYSSNNVSVINIVDNMWLPICY